MKLINVIYSSVFLLFFLLISTSSLSAQNSDGFVDFKELDKNSLNEIHITVAESNWQYLLDSLRYNGDDQYEIEQVAINGNNYQNAAISYVQESSFKADQQQRSLLLNVDGNPLKLVKFGKDPSLVREMVATEIYSNFMVVPQVAYTKVYVNKKFYGLLLAREQVTKSFVQQHFGNRHSAEPLKTIPEFALDSSSDCLSSNYGALKQEIDPACLDKLYSGGKGSDLVKLTEELKSEGGNPGQLLDIESAIWMLALNDVTMNFNSYNGFKSTNYYLVEDQFGRYNFVPFDFELAFGAKKRVTSQSDYSMTQMAELPLAFHLEDAKYPLINKLLQEDDHFRAYISNCRAIVKEYYVSGKYLEIAASYQSLIDEVLDQDPMLKTQKDRILGNLTMTVGSRSKIPGIQEIVEARKEFLKKETILKILGPKLMDYSFIQRQRFSNVKIEDFVLSVETDQFTEAVKVHYRFSDKQPFVSTNLMDDGVHHDEKSNDKIFGVKISPPDGFEDLEFYFEVDNSKMKSYYPNNFDRKTLKANLKTLNE
jgi:hypothetical protein